MVDRRMVLVVLLFGISHGAWNCLMIIDSRAPTVATTELAAELEAAGAVVTFWIDSDPTYDFSSGDVDLLVMTYQGSGFSTESRYAHAPVPVIVTSWSSMDEFQMSTYGIGSSVDRYVMVESTHPLSSGSLGTHILTLEVGTLWEGVLELSPAHAVAHRVAQPTDFMLWSVEPGVLLLDGIPADARRIALPTPQFTSAGLTMKLQTEGRNMIARAADFAFWDSMASAGDVLSLFPSSLAPSTSGDVTVTMRADFNQWRSNAHAPWGPFNEHREIAFVIPGGSCSNDGDLVMRTTLLSATVTLPGIATEGNLVVCFSLWTSDGENRFVEQSTAVFSIGAGSSCAPPPEPAGGSLGTCSTPTANGATCEIVCDAIVLGPPMRCTGGDFESIQTCGAGCAREVEGSFEINSCASASMYNEQCLWSCTSGGEAINRTCLPSGEWEGDSLSCAGRACPPLLAGGSSVSQFLTSSCINSTVEHGGMCTQTCATAGFFGGATRTCTDGLWSEADVTCLPEPCPVLPRNNSRGDQSYISYCSSATTASGDTCELRCSVAGTVGNSILNCTNGVWSPITEFCAPTQCEDGRRRQQETDVDCGGPSCQPCDVGLNCDVDTDCKSVTCTAGVCAVSWCLDGVFADAARGETDVDCGGSCGWCLFGENCNTDDDCQEVCDGGVCAGIEATHECFDGTQWTLLHNGTGSGPGFLRYYGAMALDAERQQLWIFGGRDECWEQIPDMWFFDIPSQTWNLFATFTVEPNYPPSHGMSSILWHPGIRDDITVTIGEDKNGDSGFYLIGGIDWDNGYKEDLWFFSFDTKLWTWTSGRSGVDLVLYLSPLLYVSEDHNIGSRASTSMIYVGLEGVQRLYVSGGVSDAGFICDLWAYDIASGGWTNIYYYGHDLASLYEGVPGKDYFGFYFDVIPPFPGCRASSTLFVSVEGDKAFLYIYGGRGLDYTDQPLFYDHSLAHTYPASEVMLGDLWKGDVSGSFASGAYFQLLRRQTGDDPISTGASGVFSASNAIPLLAEGGSHFTGRVVVKLGGAYYGSVEMYAAIFGVDLNGRTAYCAGDPAPDVSVEQGAARTPGVGSPGGRFGHLTHFAADADTVVVYGGYGRDSDGYMVEMSDLWILSNPCADRILTASYETDIDCGGSCPGCAPGLRCIVNADCLSDMCSAGICEEPVVVTTSTTSTTSSSTTGAASSTVTTASPSSTTSGDGSTTGVVCTPILSCSEEGKSCGSIPDGCGSVLPCGGCPAGQACGAEAPNECGVGTCTPRTCADALAECGSVSDGCADALLCGTCAPGLLCSANTCVVSTSAGTTGTTTAAPEAVVFVDAPEKKSGTAIWVVLVVLMLLCCGVAGASAVFFSLQQKKGKQTEEGTTTEDVVSSTSGSRDGDVSMRSLRLTPVSLMEDESYSLSLSLTPGMDAHGTLAGTTIQGSGASSLVASEASLTSGSTPRSTTSTSLTKDEEYYKTMMWTKGTKLGAGAFGAVYLCQDMANGRLMAVKMALSSNVKERQNAEEEYRIARLCSHQNVAQYLGTDEITDPDTNNLVHCSFVEYFPCGSVIAFNKDIAITNSTAAMYTTQILTALEYIHSLRVVHRDVKSANFLVEPRTVPPTVKLGDFGLALQLHEERPTFSGIAGTPNFLAPEVARDGDVANELCDVYSLGCAVVEMMTGKPPTSLPVDEAIAFAATGKEAPIPINLPTECIAFLRKSMASNPRSRASAQELLRMDWITSSAPFRTPTLTPASSTATTVLETTNSTKSTDPGASSSGLPSTEREETSTEGGGSLPAPSSEAGVLL